MDIVTCNGLENIRSFLNTGVARVLKYGAPKASTDWVPKYGVPKRLQTGSRNMGSPRRLQTGSRNMGSPKSLQKGSRNMGPQGVYRPTVPVPNFRLGGVCGNLSDSNLETWNCGTNLHTIGRHIGNRPIFSPCFLSVLQEPHDHSTPK